MNIKNIIKAALFTPGVGDHWGLPMLVESDPGESKSSQIGQVASDTGLYCETFMGSIHDPTDLSGLPRAVPVEGGEGHTVQMASPEIYGVLKSNPHSVLFLDELNTCSMAMQAAMLRVVLERAVGRYRLPMTTRVIAAQNQLRNSTGGSRLSRAMLNRFIIVPWEGVDANNWCSWMSTHDFDFTDTRKDTKPQTSIAQKIEEEVTALWPEEFGKSKGFVTAYIRNNSTALRDDASKVVGDKSYAKPRSWTMLAHAYAGAKIHKLNDDETTALLYGCVGQVHAEDFLQYASKLDIPDCKAIVDGTLNFTPSTARIDVAAIVAETCSSIVRGALINLNGSINLVNLAAKYSEAGLLDAGVSMLRVIAMRTSDITSHDEAFARRVLRPLMAKASSFT